MVNYKKKNKNKKKSQNESLDASNNDEHPKQAPKIVTEDDSEVRAKESIKKPMTGATKRQHDDDSDADEKPQKKKKKKQVVATETSDKKGKKSIRQIKREKFAKRQAEAQASAKDHLKGQCLNYLSQWKHDRPNWKFMKAKQVWIYKNKFSPDLLPDSSWPLFLEYFESAKGNIRNMLLDDAKKVIKQMDEWTESQNGDEQNKDVVADEDDNGEASEDTPDTKKPDENVYKRARDLIQCLEE
ncbi:unnamed protein product [Chrysodeixis includens]|uniref:WKF domain-containing protein n=1 Tax=Chrysodeixis includens TaxID=689277 RepID=A0A9P0FS86_CHRIL|nr:unnamed protein product [Chrysodeixis includens]